MVRPPAREAREGSLVSFWGRSVFAADPFCPGTWVGGHGESREIVKDSKLKYATVKRCLALCLGSTVDAKLGLGCGF